MRNMLSRKVTDIEPSGIRKFFDIVSEMPDAISLGVGEPDFDTPWHIREEGIYSLEKGRTFYTSNSGLMELRQEICNYLQRRVGVSYNAAKETLVTVGGSEAIDIALRALLEPGEEVLIPQPSYVSYLPCTVLADGVPVVIELQEKNQFRLTREELLDAITPKTKVLVLPFPNNPTGAVMEKADLEAIADVIIEKDLFVLSDEIYSELSYHGDHCSIASLPGMKERTLLINGFSKSYAMTGWRLGYSAAPAAIAKAIQMIQDHTTSNVCTFAQYGGIEALTGDQSFISDMRDEYDMRRQYVYSRLSAIPNISVVEPQGAFYFFVDTSRLGLTSLNLCDKLLERYKVAAVPGIAFGNDKAIRISYCTTLDILKEALDRFEEFCKAH